MNQQELTQKRRAVLDDTIAHFNLKNRSVIYATKSFGGRCKYFSVAGGGEGEIRGCAIGRLIQDKGLCRRLDDETPTTSVSNPVVFEQLPPELQELGQDFLSRLQNLHDIEGNWDEKGLSEEGKSYVADIRACFGL